MSSTNEIRLKQSIDEYYSTLYKLEQIKQIITEDILNSDSSNLEFIKSTLNNAGLGTELIFDILKKFVKE